MVLILFSIRFKRNDEVIGIHRKKVKTTDCGVCVCGGVSLDGESKS